MPRLIGEPSQFAIQYEIDRSQPIETQRDWLLGWLCFWANGDQIGDYKLGGSLVVAAGLLSEITKWRGQRCDPALAQLSDEALFNAIHDALYVDRGQTLEEAQRDSERYSKFLALPEFEVFNDWKAFVLENELHARYVWKNVAAGASRVGHVILRLGEFDLVVEQFLSEMKNEGVVLE
jgi:hypothetical protein